MIITAGGENIPRVLIEDVIKRDVSCVASCMVVGDKRKYLSILLTLKAEVDLNTMMPLQELTEFCREWMQSQGSNSKTVHEVHDEVVANPRGSVASAIQSGIDR